MFLATFSDGESDSSVMSRHYPTRAGLECTPIGAGLRELALEVEMLRLSKAVPNSSHSKHLTL